MSAITKNEEFNLIEQAVKVGTAPQPVVDAFNELSTVRAELKKLAEPEGYYLKAMNCPHHHRIFCGFKPFLLKLNLWNLTKICNRTPSAKLSTTAQR